MNPILKGQNIPIFLQNISMFGYYIRVFLGENIPMFGAIHPGVLGIQSYSERYSVTESLP